MPNAGNMKSNKARFPAVKNHAAEGKHLVEGDRHKYIREGTEGTSTEESVGISIGMVRILIREGVVRDGFRGRCNV